MVAEYEASGLNQRQFCESRGLCLATLSRYRKRLREMGGEASGGQWVAVEVSGSCAGRAHSGLSVVLGRGRKIEVGRGFDAATLVELMSVLERF